MASVKSVKRSKSHSFIAFSYYSLQFLAYVKGHIQSINNGEVRTMQEYLAMIIQSKSWRFEVYYKSPSR